MSEAAANTGRRRLPVRYLILAVAVPLLLGLDLYTKWLAVEHLRPLQLQPAPQKPYLTIIDGFFRLKYAENPGAAWGLLRNLPEAVRTPVLGGIALLAVGFLLWFVRRLEDHRRLLPVAAACILAGALGNLIDRLRQGYVVDFVDWYLVIGGKERHWPTFNIADAALSVGVALILFDMLVLDKRRQRRGGNATG